MTEEYFTQCMTRIAGGDRDALREIYEEYLPYIYTVVYGVLGNKEDAEDVSTDFFLRLWNTADRYRSGSGHKGYLATIARNMSIDLLRKMKREVLVDDFECADGTEGGSLVQTEEGTLAVRSDTGDGSPVEREVDARIGLQEALAQLKPAEKQIIDMKILSDMTFKEIAETLKIPIGTVTWRYREAVEKLRRCGYEQGF